MARLKDTNSVDMFAQFEFVSEVPSRLRAQAQKGDPVQVRRAKMLEAIDQQRDFWADPSKLEKVEGKRKPLTWIKRDTVDPDTIYLSPRYGVRPIELRPGMPILKLKPEQVEPFLDALQAAVVAGKLDETLARLAERTFKDMHAKAA